MALIIVLLGLATAVAYTARYSHGERVSGLLFLFSAVHVLYVFPKVFALVVSGSPTAEYFRASGATFTVAYMAVLSYLATIAAYTILAPKKKLAYCVDNFPQFEGRLVRYCLFVGGLGLLAFVGLISRSGGVGNYFFGLQFYQMELSGINVWLIFLSRFTYPAIAVAALVAALRPSKFSFILLGLFSVFPLLNVLVLFRRSDMLFLGFIALHVLVITGRIRVNRIVMISAIGLASVAILLFPYLRQDAISGVSGWDYGTADLTVKERLLASFDLDDSDEIVRAASTIDHTYQAGSYQFGAFIWDSLVDQFVPATLVGAQVKNSLYLGRGLDASQVQKYFDEGSFFYVAPMGFAQAYAQFGPFGWILFAGLGVLAAITERRSAKVSNLVFTILAIPVICLAATNDISSIPARLATFWLLTRFLGGLRLKTLPSSLKRRYGLAKVSKLSGSRSAVE